MNSSSHKPSGDPNMNSDLGRKAELVRLELILVVTLILILAGIAHSRYVTSISWAREVTHKQDLVVLRAVEQYTLDRHSAPRSLADLIQLKYLSTVPIDPITHEEFSLQDCADGYMDPVETIPGFRHLYSYSTDTSGKRSYL